MSPPDKPLQARLPRDGTNSPSTEETSPPPPMKTVIQCIRLDFFNSNTKCLEQIDFAAPVFIMQEELSLIR